MGQLHGQIVATGLEHDAETGSPTPGIGKVGIVESTGTATLSQPDRVTRDVDTGAEVARLPQPNLSVQQVNVAWEDGTRSTLTEHLDQWVVLGSVAAFPKIDNPAAPPAGAFGELADQQAATQNVVQQIGTYASELRAAGPLADARVEAARNVEVVDDGGLTLVES